MTPVRLLLAPLALLATLGSCAAQTVPAHPLAGSAWRFTVIDGAPPASDRASLTFERETIGANVGCNGMGGAWRVENERLIAGPLMQTQMYCDGPVMAQEQAVSAMLVAAPRIVLSGDRLVLQSSGHSAELARVRAAR